MGGKSSTSTSSFSPPPEVMAAYKSLINQATPISQTPYQPYTGGVNGSGYQQDQLTGFQNIGNLAGSSNGSFNSASNALNSAMVPTSANVSQYMSPYINDVANATMANMAEQNGQQQQQVLGNAIAQGAMGGNRVGVAQSELARQQNLANQQTISGLYNSGYNTALGAAQANQQAQLQAGQAYGNLGQTQMNTNLGQAAAQVGAGTQQQQFNYQQYQNQLAYPFETTSWLANIVEGAGAGMGGTTTSTQPSGNGAAGILGGLLSLPWASGGVVHGDERPRRATGGVIPYSGSSGILSANNNNPGASNDNGGYVPQVATGTTGHAQMPPAPQPQATQPNQAAQDFGAIGGALKNKYPNGILSSINTVALPDTAPIPTPNPMTGEAGLPDKIGDVAAPTGILSGLGSLFGLADGGVVPRGYDGGVVPRGYDVGGSVGGMSSMGGGIGGQGGNYSNNNRGGGWNPQTLQNFRDAFSQGGGGWSSFLGKGGGPTYMGKGGARTPMAAATPATTFASGGVARKHYDIGGAIDTAPDNLLDGIRALLGNSDAPAPLSDASFAARAPQPAPDAAPAIPDATPPVGPTGVVAPAGGGVVPPMPAPKTIKDYPVAVVPADTPANAALPISGASQGIYDSFMNTVRDQVTNPFGLAAVAATGAAESKFSPQNAFSTWSDPDQKGNADTAGGILSWRGPRLQAMQQFVKANGGDPNQPSPQLQAQFFLQEDPSLIHQLNSAKSPAEAQQIMNGAWRFAGYDQAGGEAARRIAMANSIAPQFAGDGSGDSASPASSAISGLLSPGTDSTQTGSTGGPTGVVQPFSNGQTPDANSQGRPYTSGIIDAVSGLLHGQMPNISPDARMALMSAGLGMMASKSPNFLNAVGEGGQQGVKTFQERQQQARENAQAQSNIGYQKGSLDLKGKQLALDAKKYAADIANTTALTAKTNVETAAARYPQTPTNVGFITRDVTQPNAPVHLNSWSNQPSGEPDATPPGVMAPAAAGAPGAASNGAASQAPVTAAPVRPVGPSPAGEQPQFVNKAPSNIPIDGRLMGPLGSVGSGIVQNETNDALKAARTNYQAANASQLQLAEMKHDLASMSQSAWTAPGPSASFRTTVARAINTPFQMTGFGAPIDEQAIAAGEDMKKQSTKLGFALSSTLGSGEAASIIERAVAAVPSAENSPEGFRRIIAGIQAGNQRANDYYSFLQDWSAKTGGSVKGADEYFNRVNPPEKYATGALLQMAVVPKTQADIDKAPAGTMFNINGQLMVK